MVLHHVARSDVSTRFLGRQVSFLSIVNLMSTPTLATSAENLHKQQFAHFSSHSKVASSQLFPSKDESDFRKTDSEFQILDYTAILQDSNLSKYPPNRKEIEDFPIDHDLKVATFKRHTKIALCITMYNETIDLFIKSIQVSFLTRLISLLGRTKEY